MLLKDISPLHNAILEGDYDDDLNTLSQAVEYRRKQLLKTRYAVGSTVTIVNDPMAGALAGKKVRVRKINKKTVSVDLVDAPEWARGYRVTPGLIAS